MRNIVDVVKLDIQIEDVREEDAEDKKRSMSHCGDS